MAMHPSKFLHFALLFLYICSSMCHAAAAGKGNDFSLAISGGVSLGAYEAGLNWTIVNYQKSDGGSHLRSVTGASAGSINALLSAVSWCLDEGLASQQQSAIAAIVGGDGGVFNSAGNNLLREIWLRIGFDKLLPADQIRNELYMPEDALLTRYAFREVIAKIVKLAELRIFSNCAIPMGLVVTRVTPLALKIKNVQINSTRMVIPLLVRAGGDHGLEFHGLLLPEEEKRFGSVIYLPTLDPVARDVKLSARHSASYPIGIKSVITAILTSSAYPVAFGRINLAHCQPLAYGDLQVNTEKEYFSQRALNHFQTEEVTNGQYHCPQGTALARAEFVDGGAFDNLPVGLSAHLNQIERGDAPVAGKSVVKHVNYYYMDPDNLRPGGRKDRSKTALGFSYDAKVMSFDIVEQLRFLLGSSKASSDNELYNSFRWNPIPKDDLYLTTRFAPLTGKYWGHFGAFIDFSFREYDYFVGIYDGIVALSEQRCAAFNDAEGVASERQYRACVDDNFFKIYNQLNRSGDIVLAYMIRLLTSYENESRGFSSDDLREKLRQLPGSACLQKNAADACGMQPDDRQRVRKLTMIHDALTKRTERLRAASDVEYAGQDRQVAFTDFIYALKGAGYPSGHNEAVLDYILENADRDPNTWYRPLVTRASHRLIKLENTELYTEYDKSNHADGAPTPNNAALSDATQSVADQGTDFGNLKPVAKFSVFASAVVANTLVGFDSRLSLTQSSSPEIGAWALVPYELGIDVRNGGMVGSWEPSWNMGGNHFLNLKLMPYDNNRYGEYDVHMSQVDVLYKYRTGFAISSVAIGGNWTRTYKDWGGETRQFNHGLAAHIGLLADKLRISIGKHAYDSDYFPGNNFYLTFSLTDVPGLFYWLHETYNAGPGEVRRENQKFFP